jgi:hypothetical protein
MISERLKKQVPFYSVVVDTLRSSDPSFQAFQMSRNCSLRLGVPHESSSLSNLLLVRPGSFSTLFFLIPLQSSSSLSFLNFLVVSPHLSSIFSFLFLLLIQSSSMEVLYQSKLQKWGCNIPRFLGKSGFSSIDRN